MIIDCDTCAVRGDACGDCVVGVLLGTPAVPGRGHGTPAGSSAGREPAGPGDPLPVEFGPVERRALEVLADHGLIPRLRLVPRTDDAPVSTPGASRAPQRGRGRRDVG